MIAISLHPSSVSRVHGGVCCLPVASHAVSACKSIQSSLFDIVHNCDMSVLMWYSNKLLEPSTIKVAKQSGILVGSPAYFYFTWSLHKFWLTVGCRCWAAESWRSWLCWGKAVEELRYFGVVEVVKISSSKQPETEECPSKELRVVSLRKYAKCGTLCGWINGFQFLSEVNSFMQQIWLLVSLSIWDEKLLSPAVQNNAVNTTFFEVIIQNYFSLNLCVLRISTRWRIKHWTSLAEMEPKHKELLDQYHQNLLESITDAERVVEFLAKTGTLTQVERFELENNCSSSSEKVDLLLKMLMSKERDHFQDLCLALEKTHPHLYSTLVVNGGGSMDHSGKKWPVKRSFNPLVDMSRT